MKTRRPEPHTRAYADEHLARSVCNVHRILGRPGPDPRRNPARNPVSLADTFLSHPDRAHTSESLHVEMIILATTLTYYLHRADIEPLFCRAGMLASPDMAFVYFENTTPDWVIRRTKGNTVDGRPRPEPKPWKGMAEQREVVQVIELRPRDSFRTRDPFGAQPGFVPVELWIATTVHAVGDLDRRPVQYRPCDRVEWHAVAILKQKEVLSVHRQVPMEAVKAGEDGGVNILEMLEELAALATASDTKEASWAEP